MKYLKISFLIFFLFILGQMRTFSQDKVKGVIVELNSGKKLEFRLDDHPKFLFKITNQISEKNAVSCEAVTVRLVYTK